MDVHHGTLRRVLIRLCQSISTIVTSRALNHPHCFHANSCFQHPYLVLSDTPTRSTAVSARISPAANNMSRGEDSLEHFQTQLLATSQHVQQASLVADLAPLKSQLENLRQSLTQHARTWAAYDVRRATENLLALEEDFDAASRRIKPRSSFKFKRSFNSTVRAVKTSVPATAVQPQGAHPSTQVDDRRSAASDVTLTGLQKESINLLKIIPALRISDLSDCNVITGPVTGSIHVTRCTGCTFRVMARQIRIHDSRDCSFFLDVASEPVIENCDSMTFGAYDVAFDGRQSLLENAGWESSGDLWKSVKDFNWLHEEQSPHWRLATREEQAQGRIVL